MLIAACTGFLLAVLWMDLMFDVQVLRQAPAPAPLPEPVLASIAGYYARVTTAARPMNRMIALTMLVLLAAAVAQLLRGSLATWAALLIVLLTASATGLAGARVVPNAVRLGTRADSIDRQSELARAICRDHLFCLAAMTLVLVLQLGCGR